MVFQACPRCASTDLEVPKFKDGMVPEIDNLAEWVCRRCDLRAVPLEFEEEEDLRAFAASRA